MRPKDADRMANSVDSESDLGLHCLPRPTLNLGSLQYFAMSFGVCNQVKLKLAGSVTEAS